MYILSSLFSSALLVWPAPTSEMKPWAYNWWMGSAVDEAGEPKGSELIDIVVLT